MKEIMLFFVVFYIILGTLGLTIRDINYSSNYFALLGGGKA